MTGPPGSSKAQEKKYYGVAVGKVPGVYEQWSEAEAQIQGVKGPKYKKFPTRAEAEEFVRAGGKKTATTSKKDGKEVKNNTVESFQQPAAKKAKTSAGSSSRSTFIKIYTDGSALGNGKVGSKAGVGVFFGVNDDR